MGFGFRRLGSEVYAGLRVGLYRDCYANAPLRSRKLILPSIASHL